MQKIISFCFSFQKQKFLALLILFGIVVKLCMLPFYPQPGDYTFSFCRGWNLSSRTVIFEAFRYPFANYTPAYLYFLLLIAKLGVAPLVGIKLLSVLFEYVAAWFVGAIAYQKYKENWVRWCAFAVVPLLPTVLINSSYWAQCDSIYASFLLGSIYFVMKKRSLLSVLFLGISFPFKLQAVLLFPFSLFCC